jgi:hypothetical protein
VLPCPVWPLFCLVWSGTPVLSCTRRARTGVGGGGAAASQQQRCHEKRRRHGLSTRLAVASQLPAPLSIFHRALFTRAVKRSPRRDESLRSPARHSFSLLVGFVACVRARWNPFTAENLPRVDRSWTRTRFLHSARPLFQKESTGARPWLELVSPALLRALDTRDDSRIRERFTLPATRPPHQKSSNSCRRTSCAATHGESASR